MSKKTFGSGITRLLFGLGKKEMKVIPYNEMSPEQFEQLDRFLGKVGFAVANDTVSLTQRQQEYILNQIKQLDLYRERMMRDPDLVKVDKMTELKDPEFKGFTPKVIEGGKGKTKPGSKIDYDKMEEFLGVKLRGDETFEELLEIERKNKIKKFEQDNDRALEDLVDDAGGTKEGAEFDDEPFDAAGGGLVSLIERLRRKFGKKAITTADKIDRPAKAKLKKEFEAFEERNRALTEDELEDFAEEIGDNIEAYDLPQTVADRDKILKDIKDYEAEMFKQYKSGELDKYVNPDVLAKQKLDFQKKIDGVINKAYDEVAGGAGFSSGDTKYDAEILRDSIYEQMRPGKDIDNLSDKQKMQLYDSAYKYLTMIKPKKTLESIKKTGSIDISDPAIAEEFAKFMKRTDPDKYAELEAFIESLGRTKQAKGGIATMFRPKREKFIFGGGVGLKGYLKMLAEGRKTKEGKAFKGSDTLKYGNPKSQVPKFAKQFISDRDKAEMKRLRIAQLENVLEGLKSDRQFLESYEKMANLFPEVNKLSYDMLEELLPAQHKKRFKGLTTEMLDKEILQVENVLKNLKVGKDQRALNAEGGRIGFDKGGIFGSGSAPSDVIDSDLLDIGFDNLTLDEMRDILNSIGVDKKAEGGLATMFRPKLKDGGPPNPGRRTFLKLLGGLASIPVVGKLFKPATKVAKIVPLKNTTTAMPTWFPDFVEKMTIRNVGNKIDADITLFEDPKLPGVKVYKYDDGRVSVEGQNEYYANYEIDYKPPGYEVVDYETGKAVRTKGEFEAVDADPIADYDGSIADYEPRTLESVDGIMSSDARRMEGYAKDVDPNKIPLKSGEGQVIENEVRAESAMDAAREAAEEIDDFADGGLATMFRKK